MNTRGLNAVFIQLCPLYGRANPTQSRGSEERGNKNTFLATWKQMKVWYGLATPWLPHSKPEVK